MIRSPLQLGEYAGYALKSDGTVYAWGNNGVGQLGNGTTTTNTTPVQVSGLTGITTIASGGDTGYAVDDGEVQLEPPAADAVLQDNPRRAAVTRRETVGVVDYGETSFGCGGFSGSVGSARRCLVSDRRLLR